MDPGDLRLRFYPDPVLKRRADPVRTSGDELRALARRMFDVMYTEGGIGLAAPQLGRSERVFVMNLTGEKDKPEEERVFVNPVILSQDGKVTGEEGCLSLPGIRLDIERAEKIRVRALDLDGKPFEQDLDDLVARCVQHEVDHLDGILIVSRISAARRMGIRKELKELQRAYENGEEPDR